MNESDITRHVDATAALIGLPIAAEYRPGVLRYFTIASGMAGLLMSHPLTPHDEPAEVFVPVSPLPPPLPEQP